MLYIESKKGFIVLYREEYVSNTKIRIKIGLVEVEIDTPVESLERVMDNMPSLLDRVSSALASLPSTDTINSTAETPVVEMPEISVEKGDTLSDIILKIFKTQWGRGERRLSDVKKVLEYYGLPYPKQSVAVTLLRLAQHGKLRRFKGEDNEFVYTASMELLNDYDTGVL